MEHKLTQRSLDIIKGGAYRARILRGGIIQQFTFTVKKAKNGNIEYAELYTSRMVDLSELMRIADETGLPVEAENGRAFPKGTAASDFQSLL